MSARGKRVNVATMMAALFYRGVDPDRIEKMTYRRLKMYYEFHEIIEKEWAKQNGG